MTTRGGNVAERAGRGDPVALCQAMVAIPSVNPELEPGGAGEGEMARQCAEWLGKWGYEVEVSEVIPGRWNVLARRLWESGGRRLILNGHLDTVGVEGMTRPPFHGEVEDGKVWGRGACDMKGGLAIILATAAKLARQKPVEGRKVKGELVLALTADEEHASLGMQRFVETAQPADGAVVCEPTSLTVMPAHKGFFWIEARFRGKAAHGSRPEEGVDAILHAAHYLVALGEMETSIARRGNHPLLALPSFHAGTIRGGSAPSVYPERCDLVLERRTLPGEEPDRILEDFREVLDGLGKRIPALDAELKPGLFRPGTEVPLESTLVQVLLDALEAEGLPPVVDGMTAWVDAAFLNESGVPAVCFGPGSIAQAHSAEEWVEVQELEVGTRVLTRFVEEFLSGLFSPSS